ncbi:MAG: hypothetical protein R3195_00740 [Gemmatimonadota bacterium]|nr:hypothetical protein [Gemmatimonadota bacterium]
MALIKNTFAMIGFLTVLVVGLGGAWLFRDEIQTWVNDRNEVVMAEPSEELAAVAEEKIREVMEGEGGRETRLSEAELQSYVQYIGARRLPAGVNNPAVDIRDSTLALSAGLDLTTLAVGGDAVQNLRRVIGDSALVSGEVYPQITLPGIGRVEVLSLQAGMFPVPPMLIGTAIQQLGLRSEGAAVLVELPEEVLELRIENEELVLIRDR